MRVRAKRSELQSYKRTRPMTKLNFLNLHIYVVVGGGPSGAICVETLRQNGYDGRLVFVCKENFLPYDRCKVSKAMDSDPDSILLRSQEFYDKYDIETHLDMAATALNVETRELSLSDGSKIKYNKLYIATGSSPLKCMKIIN